MKFRGFQGKAIRTQQRLILRFPEDLSLRNELAVIYMTVGQNDAAKELLEDTLKTWPDSGFAKAHYGFILKNIHHDIKEGARYMREGIDSGEEGIDGRFYYHLGDAYERLGRRSDAEKIYEEGARRGYFRSKDQRSLYNVDRLESKPFWTKEETTYETFLNKLEANWEIIRDEGLSLMNLTPPEGFKDESESLRDTGDWKQFELYARGRKLPGCSKAPKTCALIGSFEPASSCKRGQAKFSVMHPGTHVWAHTGPTNCRLRSHLGLKVSEGMVIRVVNETRTWEEGKIFVFDDSFDHEVWHNGTEFRLVLIVDLWHPDLTENERQTLPAI
ncbi:hypothetical protein QYM36_017592 [Artemia franciscana]|uniref:Aspartyl/asparaginy/proline hydroxylase domain-containing protein n=2 Tax=Artemia franciscana TaxID=6661 RepID=A0AA88H8C8_ARTSF|nr:hypothetical protein QYM36_017592 [Artemia franciscana]